MAVLPESNGPIGEGRDMAHDAAKLCIFLPNVSLCMELLRGSNPPRLRLQGLKPRPVTSWVSSPGLPPREVENTGGRRPASLMHGSNVPRLRLAALDTAPFTSWVMSDGFRALLVHGVS